MAFRASCLLSAAIVHLPSHGSRAPLTHALYRTSYTLNSSPAITSLSLLLLLFPQFVEAALSVARSSILTSWATAKVVYPPCPLLEVCPALGGDEFIHVLFHLAE